MHSLHQQSVVHSYCNFNVEAFAGTLYFSLYRYNDFKNDPLSKCNCTPPYSGENGISARSDLNPADGKYPIPALGHRMHGGTDCKVIHSKQIAKLATLMCVSLRFVLGCVLCCVVLRCVACVVWCGAALRSVVLCGVALRCVALRQKGSGRVVSCRCASCFKVPILMAKGHLNGIISR